MIVLILLIFGVNIKAIPMVDLANIHKEAILMLESGEITSYNYFGRYGNNIPIVILIYLIFKSAITIGIDDLRLVGIIFNVIMISIGIVFSYLIILKLKNKKVALIFLILCLFNPVLYVYTPYYYTDTISIPFMMAGIYIFIKSEEEKNLYLKRFYQFLIAAIIFFGFKIRATVGIIGIAIVLYKFYISKRKECILFILFFTIGIFIANFNYRLLEDKYVRFDKSSYEFPVTHWIMMGHQGEGGYSSADVEFTQSFETKSEKTKANLETLNKRLKEMGLTGYLELIGKKMQIVWSGGTHRYEQYLSTAEEYTGLYNYIVGDQNDIYVYYCQIFNGSLIFLILFGAINYIRKKSIDYFSAVYLLLFGAIIFYLLWEAHPKYSISFMLLMILLMTIGQQELKRISDLIIDDNICINIIGTENKGYGVLNIKRQIVKLGRILLIITLIIISTNYYKYTIKPIPIQDFVVKQDTNRGENIKEITKDDVIVQTFETNKEFNTIEINMQTHGRKNTCSYIIELQSEIGKTVYKEKINAEDIKDNKYKKIIFDTVIPNELTVYRIKIYSNDAVKGNSLALPRFCVEGYDVVPSGKLYINQKETTGDLMFKVYNYTKKPYVSKFYYLILSGIIVFGEVYLIRIYREY